MAVAFFSYMDIDRHLVAKIKGRAVNSNYPTLDFRVKDLLRRWETDDDIVIKRAITMAMNGTSRTIVFLGEHTYKSKWVQHEVNFTLQRGKPVYAMWLKDKVGNLPKCLVQNKIKAHEWSEEKLQILATK